MRVAAVQTRATADRDGNLRAAADLVTRAADAGASLVVLPEYFSVAGSPSDLVAGAEPLDGPTATWARETAARHGLWLVAGSFPELGAAGSGRVRNTSLLVDPAGSVRATYRKIHLFDCPLTGSRESEVVEPGDRAVVHPIGEGPWALGLTTCYDLRFPELYRALALAGATVVAVPAAFTAVTGAAHWELLLRARAVEEQVYVVGADQVGELPPGMPACHGHSMVVDPWGTVVAGTTSPDPDVVVADLDPATVDDVRRHLPVLQSLRPETYGVHHA